MLQDKYEHLKSILRDLESVIVAFSGGIDSTLLLKVSLDILGSENVLAITANSESYPQSELKAAIAIANEIGAPHKIIDTSELNIPGYSNNDKDRCYYCKNGLFEEIKPVLDQIGFKNVVYGLIADDINEYRPGARAAKEQGVKGPLQEAGLYKSEIRELAQMLNLSNWNKPSLACLSSRIAYGEKITLQKLTKIELSERYLIDLGVKQVRVRTHGDIARIEVEPEEMDLIIQHNESIAEKLKIFGYKYVSLDLLGYKTGSMNKALS